MTTPTCPSDAAEDQTDAVNVKRRQALMKVCACASEDELAGAVAGLGLTGEIVDVRKPETGLVMLRGRMGGDGPPFNVGEASVTRAVVRLGDGTLGTAYQLGRSHKKAHLAAIVDAAAQTESGWQRLQSALIEPVQQRHASEKAMARAKTAATKVDFFTLVRGED